jgi:hypothetical protein
MYILLLRTEIITRREHNDLTCTYLCTRREQQEHINVRKRDSLNSIRLCYKSFILVRNETDAKNSLISLTLVSCLLSGKSRWRCTSILLFSLLFSLLNTVSPVCRASQKTTYGVGRNEVVQVSCDVDADPSNVSFKWHINNSDISTELKSFTSNGTRSLSSYAATNPRSYGKLICWGENSIGRQREPCVYSIVPASKTLTSQTEHLFSLQYCHLSVSNRFLACIIHEHEKVGVTTTQ